ncbi:MAG: DNA repair protein RecN [Nitriliruptorales bacterium]
MLDELHIAGIGVIRDATLRLAPGLTVVTGETGAGKTMVVTALELLLGARADSTLVRAGADAGLVEARVRPVPEPAVESGWAESADEEIVLSRELPADGRSRARIAGRLATVSALDEVLGRSVEVHGQGDHARLSRPAVQRRLIDRYAGEPHRRTLEAHREAFAALRTVRARLLELSEGARERAREADRLAHEVAEIERAELDPDSDTRLEGEESRLENAELLTESALTAAAALDEDGAGGPLGVAVAALRRAADHDPEFATLSNRLEDVAALVTDLRRDLRAEADTVAADPARLEEIRARRRLLADLTRKYGDGIDEVLAYAADAAERLAALTGDESASEELESEAARLQDEVERLASDLRRGRELAAERLAEAVSDHLEDLGMPHAAFSVAVEATDEHGPDGADRVTLLLAPNPGEPPVPLGKAASGGERSRAALAVEVALADVDDIEVLVFDEVDAGVGGAAAMAVGEKLARLARDGRRQVLCVTHLAQLAAFADVHHVVEKGVEDGRTSTALRRVEDGDRPRELARMLSGDPDRDTALEHARELLAEAAGRRGDGAATTGMRDSAERLG